MVVHHLHLVIVTPDQPYLVSPVLFPPIVVEKSLPETGVHERQRRRVRSEDEFHPGIEDPGPGRPSDRRQKAFTVSRRDIDYQPLDLAERHQLEIFRYQLDVPVVQVHRWVYPLPGLHVIQVQIGRR